MQVDNIKKVTVVGSGTMGNGIAQIFAAKGFDVNLVDMNQEILDAAKAAIDKSLSRLVKKEIISDDDKSAALARINTSTELGVAKDSQLVIEAVTETLDLKIEYFKKLYKNCPPYTILSLNLHRCRLPSWPRPPSAPTNLSACIL